LIKLKKYIAFLLFGIFFFPIVFQSVHIVWHHAHGYKCNHNHHHIIVEVNLHQDVEKISETEQICPICEFHFSINNVPKTSFFNSVIPVFAYLFNVTADNINYTQIYTFKSPRAPPFYFA